jgi:hypothetical protein
MDNHWLPLRNKSVSCNCAKIKFLNTKVEASSAQEEFALLVQGELEKQLPR